ncbi:uncharacterized protein LOC144097656 [Amblyomma americanum]
MSSKKAGAEKEDHPADIPHEEDHRDSRKDDHKDDRKQASKDNKKDDQKPVNKQSEKDPHKDNHQDAHHDAQTTSPKDTPKNVSGMSTPHASTADVVKKLIRRRQSDGLLLAPLARRRSLAPSELLASALQRHAPWDGSGGVAAESAPDHHDRAKELSSFPYPTIGTCSCHPACNCRKPCKCDPPPCPCKGPIVKSIGGGGSGSVVSTMVPMPVPFPMPGYNDGTSSGPASSGSRGCNEPIVINPYPATTSVAPTAPTPPAQPPPEPHGRPPTSVHELVSLMKTLMLNRIRDDLLRQWGVEASTSAAAPATPEARSPTPTVLFEPGAGPSRIAQQTAAVHQPPIPLRSYGAERDDDDEPPPRLTAIQRRPTVAPRILKGLGKRNP